MIDVPNYIKAEADYINGMKYKDIANKYDVSINTVKSWKTRYGWSKGEKGVHTKSKKYAHIANKSAEQKQIIAEDVNQVIDNPELNDKQRLFCLYQSRMFNGTKAYQKAYQCSYETAMVESCRLLRNPKIIEQVNALKQAKLNRAMLSEPDIFQKYMDIAFADITDFVEFGREEIPVMTAFGPLEVKDEETGKKIKVMKEVNTVRFREHTEVDGTIITEVKQGRDGASIKLEDRMKALNWIAEHMDLATEKQRAEIDAIRYKVDTDKDKPIQITFTKAGDKNGK